MTTFEEAKRCPKCKMPGNSKSKIPAPNGNGIVHTIECANERCDWYMTHWVVQVRSDGTIPDMANEPGPAKPKLHGRFSDQKLSEVRAAIRQQRLHSQE